MKMIHYLFNFEKKMLSVVNFEHFRFFCFLSTD
jgi:hypothetical protein